MTRLARVALVGAWSACGACAPAEEGPSVSPGEKLDLAGGTPSSVAPTPPRTNEAPTVVATPLARVRARDRDPEEERRKMSLSREHSARAHGALRSGASGKAVREARQALRIHEQNVEAMLVIAEVFYKQGRHEITQSITSSVLEVDPKVLKPEESSRAYNLKGFAFLAEGNKLGAMRAFRKSAELDEKNGAAWNNLGVQYMLQEEYAVAASCFKYALDLDPTFFKAQINQGASLRAQGKLVEAEQAFKKAARLRPKYAEAHFNLGVLYLDAEDFPQLDVTTRLNRAIREFSQYKDLAYASGRGPSSAPMRPGAVGAGGGVNMGKELVSPAQADLYIGVAKKGLERELRRKERANRRSTEAASEASGSTHQDTPSGEVAAPASLAPASGSPGAQRPEEPKPGREKLGPRKPGAPKPGAQQPGAQRPGAQKPGAPKPEAQKPGAQKPGAEKPEAQKPGARKPGAQRPAPQRPGAQKPRAQNKPGA